MNERYLRAVLGGALLAIFGGAALWMAPGSDKSVSPAISRSEIEAIPVAFEPLRSESRAELIGMAKDAVITRLIGAGDVKFSRVSALRARSGKRVVCGSVSFKQPVYLPARTERFVTLFPERDTTLESGHSDFMALMRTYCVNT